MGGECRTTKPAGPSCSGLRGFWRNQRGGTLTEFAAVAAPFFALTIAVIQTSLTLFTQQVLETSAEKSARMVMTGRAQTASLTKEAFRKEVCSTLPVHMRCADLFVDTRVASNFSSANVSASDLVYDSVSGDLKDTTTYEPGLPGDIVVMRLMYQSSVISGPLGFDLSNMQGDRRLLIATSIFKNETY